MLQVESHELGDPQFFIDEGMVHLAFGYVELVVEGKAGYTELSALPGITPMPADGAESVTTDTALCWSPGRIQASNYSALWGKKGCFIGRKPV